MGIHLNGKPCMAFEKLQLGDRLDLRLVPVSRVDSEAMELRIAYEDEDLVVVDKAAGIVVHPTHGVTGGTLVNGLAHRYGTVHPVHRLDRETSGLVLFARHALASQRLADQLKQNKLGRSYVAIAAGCMPCDHGTIDLPIARVGQGSALRVIRADGQPARTHFSVLERDGNLTRLAVRLETGRTHQIRVHFNALGYPLVGDPLYGQAPGNRLMLHAETLRFVHPRTGELLILRSEAPF